MRRPTYYGRPLQGWSEGRCGPYGAENRARSGWEAFTRSRTRDENRQVSGLVLPLMKDRGASMGHGLHATVPEPGCRGADAVGAASFQVYALGGRLRCLQSWQASVEV
jgi:hypothetical protein